MTQDTTATDASSFEHPAADVETIVVDADDVIEAMRRNDRDRDQQRTHTLRVTPPLSGKKRATPYVSQDHSFYPSDMKQKPIHISPEAFVVGHLAGNHHPQWRGEWSHPDLFEQKSLFRDEFNARDENGDNRPLTDEEEDEWNEWWDTAVEFWEESVRYALNATDELTLTSPNPNIEDATVSVRFESNNDQ